MLGYVGQTLQLLLPAIIPSWRFFDEIAPSPRIEFAILTDEEDDVANWQEFRPRPEYLSVVEMFKRMLWNPDWNHNLYLVSCSERLMSNPTDHSTEQIFAAIQSDLKGAPKATLHGGFIQFRLVFLYRQEEEVERHVTFMSPVRKLEAN